MLIDKLAPSKREYYADILEAMGMLSGLYSESDCPYIVPRGAENSFCEATGAKNTSRKDNTADAVLGRHGVGVKTFLFGNGNTLQKVAEFDKAMASYRGKTTEEIVEAVCNIRNKRILETIGEYGLEDMIYHMVTRKPGRIEIYEESLVEVDVASVTDIVQKDNTITFRDRYNRYSFALNKSTLSKGFHTVDPLMAFDVEILEDPFTRLLSINHKAHEFLAAERTRAYDTRPCIYLPLYSDRSGRVEEHSGLNQWNASGRARDPDEVYIPIPSWVVNDVHKSFLPPRDVKFTMHLPNGTDMLCKVCQSNNKALMSDPNKDLGHWILREVLHLKEWELLTRTLLDELGIDSVRIYKEKDGTYSMEFAPSGSFEEFKLRTNA